MFSLLSRASRVGILASFFSMLDKYKWIMFKVSFEMEFRMPIGLIEIGTQMYVHNLFD